MHKRYGCQPTQAPGWVVGMCQALMQPIRRPWQFCTGAEGWLRQRVREGGDYSNSEIVLICYQCKRINVLFLVSGINDFEGNL